MTEILKLNSIASVVKENLTEDKYVITEDAKNPVGILVRSADMLSYDFPESVLAVARAGAGVNNIPCDVCAQKGIVVFNTPGANANAVKEMVLGAMIAASRNIVEASDWAKTLKGNGDQVGKMAEKGKGQFVGPEIMGKTLGVIGLGAIGIKVANAAEKLGMKVMGYDPYISVDAAWNLSRNVKHVTNLDDIYSQCDFITIHVPALPTTKGMINAGAVAKMKPNAVILNFARDILCDEDAVLAALDAGKIAKYVTDFANPKTAGHAGCIVIPHLGASTEESEDNCAVMAVNEMMDYLENGNITNSVNYPACNVGVCKTAGRVAVFHKNIANMISQLTGCFGEAGINIEEFVNKSRGEVAYTVMDIEQSVGEDIIKKLERIDGVFRARIVK